jgi:adenylate cyclase
LRKYVPTDVVNVLRTRTAEIEPSDRPLFGVCLATDVQGYTALAEILPPRALALLMNQYFDVLFEPVTRRNGIITTVAGDGVISVWTSPTPNRFLCGQAAITAFHVMQNIEAFNALHAPYILPTRFGLHAGSVVIGNVGGAGHFTYNVVGNVPNTASRIESLNKLLGTRILASEIVVEGLRHLLVRRIGRFRLMGKTEAIPIYEILCPKSVAEPAEHRRCAAFAEALDCLERRRWSDAQKAFASFLVEFPDDGPARFLYAYILSRSYEAQSLTDGDGVVICPKTK